MTRINSEKTVRRRTELPTLTTARLEPDRLFAALPRLAVPCRADGFCCCSRAATAADAAVGRCRAQGQGRAQNVLRRGLAGRVMQCWKITRPVVVSLFARSPVVRLSTCAVWCRKTTELEQRLHKPYP